MRWETKTSKVEAIKKTSKSVKSWEKWKDTYYVSCSGEQGTSSSAQGYEDKEVGKD